MRGKGTQSGYRYFPSTADMGFEVWAPSLTDLFYQAGKALISLIADPQYVTPLKRFSITTFTPAYDRETLLVLWLNDILWKHESLGVVFSDLLILKISENAIESALVGEPIDLQRHFLRHEIKAVTWHNLEIVRLKEGFQCALYLDL